MKTRISVAMTTYNGSKYILKQLDSLRMQTYEIDEVVIMDDASEDNTVDIVSGYIEKWKLSNWEIKINSKNEGWIKNFHSCISETTGDIVFFCDQDDEWELSKIAEMCDVLCNNAEILTLACKVKFIDAESKETDVSYKAIPFGVNKDKFLKKNTVNAKFSYSIMPGCTMAVRRELIEQFSNCEISREIPHDALYWKLASLQNRAYFMNKALVKYRLHEDNASNPNESVKNKIKRKEQRLKEIEIFIDNMRKVKCVYEFDKTSNEDFEYINRLNEIINFFQKRYDSIRDNKIVSYVIKKHKYYRNVNMMLGDILSCVTRD